MSEHHLSEVFLRAVPLAAIALFAVLAIQKLRRNPLAWGGLLGANLAGLCVDDPVLEARLLAALEQRRKTESILPYVRFLAIAWGCAFIGMLIAGFTGVIARAQLPTVYAITCLGFAAIMMLAYFQTRSAHPVRVAVLQARSAATVIPPYWFAAAGASAALMMLFVAQPASSIAAILVCASSLATLAIAWQLTGLPARLAGNDIEIERFVDEALRFRRAAKVLLMAILQPYAFMTLELSDATAPQTAAWILTVVLFVGFMFWMARQLRRQPVLNGAA